MKKTTHFTKTFLLVVNNLKKQVIHRGNLPYISVEEQLNLINKLIQFPLGRHLIEKKSINF